MQAHKMNTFVSLFKPLTAEKETVSEATVHTVAPQILLLPIGMTNIDDCAIITTYCRIGIFFCRMYSAVFAVAKALQL